MSELIFIFNAAARVLISHNQHSSINRFIYFTNLLLSGLTPGVQITPSDIFQNYTQNTRIIACNLTHPIFSGCASMQNSLKYYTYYRGIYLKKNPKYVLLEAVHNLHRTPHYNKPQN